VGQSFHPAAHVPAAPPRTLPWVLPCEGASLVVRLLCSLAVGVGHDIEPGPVVRCANFFRREKSRCNPVTQAVQLSADDIESEG